MVELFKQVATAAATAALVGVGALVPASPAAADGRTDCEIVRESVPSVMATAAELQKAARVRGWRWTDPDIQDARNKMLATYPFWLYADELAGLPGRSIIWDLPNGDWVGDADHLVAAMNAQMSTMRNANARADVLPDAAATVAAATALQRDCDGVN
ncbi:hypothetical protein [Tsukamurella soli]|uniref:Uncharacterized protein n=1 Tax=Tsukamurella soli TaxID=644556 RepID=A0ABP8JCY4_9ACTN